MSTKRPQIKSRVILPLPFKTFSVTLSDLTASTQPLTDEVALRAVGDTNQYSRRWGRFSPLFIPCGNLLNARVVIWIHPSNCAPGKVFDRMVCCLVWRDSTNVVRLSSVSWIVMRQHVDCCSDGWDGAIAEPANLVLSRPRSEWLVT